MARGRARWGTKSIRKRMPLPRERVTGPRFDGTYAAAGEPAFVTFVDDRTATVDGETAEWSLHAGALTISSPSWDCEGTIGNDSLFLLCSPSGDHTSRIELELTFEPAGQR